MACGIRLYSNDRQTFISHFSFFVLIFVIHILCFNTILYRHYHDYRYFKFVQYYFNIPCFKCEKSLNVHKRLQNLCKIVSGSHGDYREAMSYMSH